MATTTPAPSDNISQPLPPRTEVKERRSRKGNPLTRILLYIGLSIFVLVILIPFFWMVFSSLKTNETVFTIPIQWLPSDPQWHNYVDIWNMVPMATWVRNSLFLSVVITFLQVLTGSFAAYGFSKIQFKGRDVLFLAYVATIAVPWQAYMVPQFMMFQQAGLTNTFLAMILLQAFGAFGVFLMRQYYMSIPYELNEAARVDGLSEYGIWWRIMLPLCKPALASLALLTFVNTWNDFMGPFIYLSSNDLWTIQIGLKSFVGEYNAEYAMIMTGSVISVIPIALIFLAGQRYFVQGIASSGMKG